MYCPKCGFQNEDSSVFCVNCGKQLSNNSKPESIINNADNYITNLPPIISELKKIDSYDLNINNMQNNLKWRKNQYKSTALSFIIALLVTLFIVTPIVFIFIRLNSAILFDEANEKRLGYTSGEPDPYLYFDEYEDYKKDIETARTTSSLFFTFIIDILAFIILSLALLLINRDSNSRNKEMIEKLETDLSKEIEKKNVVIKQLSPVIHILPPNYRYALAADYIYNCFLNNRAYTIQEAVNLYEEQLHRWKIENTQEMMLTLQRQQNSDINTMKIFTGITAAASVATAFNTRK